MSMKKQSNTLFLRLCSYLSLAICFLPALDFYCPWYITMLPAVAFLFLCLQINPGINQLLRVCLYIFAVWVMLF